MKKFTAVIVSLSMILGSILPAWAAKAGAKTFPDVPKTHTYYNAIMWASSYGITTGFSDGRFKPDQTCTRGQCVTFLYRMLK